jgi:hypothetical protein
MSDWETDVVSSGLKLLGAFTFCRVFVLEIWRGVRPLFHRKRRQQR